MFDTASVGTKTEVVIQIEVATNLLAQGLPQAAATTKPTSENGPSWNKPAAGSKASIHRGVCNYCNEQFYCDGFMLLLLTTIHFNCSFVAESCNYVCPNCCMIQDGFIKQPSDTQTGHHTWQ